MNGIYKKTELAANVAIVIVAILLGVVLVKRYLLPSPSPSPAKAIAAGDKISVPNVSWEKSNRTLLVVLALGCHFCSESAPFYKRITDEARKSGNVQIVAVLPQSRAEGQKYLSDLGVPVDDIEQADLRSIQVAGTPTLILVDKRGVVIDGWFGKLPSEQETDVISKLICEDCS